MGQSEEVRRFLNSTTSRRGSLCSSKIVEIPVENFVYQTQIDTLQWQLKQTESSREMHRAVMKQVVTFLEKAHRSLELLGCRLHSNPNDSLVSRTKSEHQMNITDLPDINGSSNTATLLPDSSGDYSSFRDFTWRRPKKQQTLPEEIAPEKLAQEAFRLLRTAQSLMNTREPDLAQMTKEAEDSKFLEQLAKEFPAPKSLDISVSQRTSTFSLNTKILAKPPDKELPKISTAFNRKLSLQLTPGDLRRNSLSSRDSPKMNRYDSSSVHSNESCILASSASAFNEEISHDNRMHKLGNKMKYTFSNGNEPEKSNSPPVSTVSSAEDESGFSSMNSFQEVGVPLLNSTLIDDLKNHNGFRHIAPERTEQKPRASIDEIKLWQRAEPAVHQHKRWNSTPAESITDNNNKQSLKVLWV